MSNVPSSGVSTAGQNAMSQQIPSMTPVSTDRLEQDLRAVIQTLFEISVLTYRNDAPNPTDILVSQISDLVSKFDQTRLAAEEVEGLSVPREVIGYVPAFLVRASHKYLEFKWLMERVPLL